jgi:hypothetical protein
MIYLTAYRNASICMLHVIMTASFSFTHGGSDGLLPCSG